MDSIESSISRLTIVDFKSFKTESINVSKQVVALGINSIKKAIIDSNCDISNVTNEMNQHGGRWIVIVGLEGDIDIKSHVEEGFIMIMIKNVVFGLQNY